MKRSQSEKKSVSKKRKLDKILQEVRQIRDEISSYSSSGSESENTSDTEKISSPGPSDNNNEDNRGKENNESTNKLIDLLGSNPENKNKQQDPLHEEICLRWNVYLKQGLNKEQKEEVMKKYPVFENCQLMMPPKLNAEVQHCMDSKAIRHDQFLEKLQLQVAHALSATGVELNNILKSENQEELKNTCSTLADIGQLLCNIHQAISSSRKYQILPYLNYSSRKLIENSDRDEFLLGSNFAENVKSKEAVHKVAKDLKVVKKHYTNKPSTSKHQTQSSDFHSKNTRKQQDHLNYPRHPSSQRKKYTPSIKDQDHQKRGRTKKY
ncbi:uncharacterized protein LOC122499943 [Leptopilina heterotoma]|uniref:uncharacterized protein LOC122499943 n=1 Tax=Leptopilina heterotoma TaxID=63436 RepID=UPI001CA94295|nr:uncharacterized protein LOC122499943 [Leptopilina heterotoma]XP_043464485.1 uncharacterized protein LOC122499943 [Leptopilina heterotoma]